jgi:membrane protein
MEEKLRAFWDGVFGARGAASALPAGAKSAFRFLYLVIKDFRRNRCLEKASSLGFQTILSVVPALVLALFLLRSLGASDTLAGDVTKFILHQLNADRITLSVPASGAAAAVTFKLSDKLQEIVAEVDGVLRSSGAGLASFFGIVFAAIFMALEIEYSLNSIWNAVTAGGVLRRLGVYWSLVTFLPLFVGLALYAGRLFPAAAFLDAPAGVAIPFIAFYLLYKFVPAAHVDHRAAGAGAVAAAVAWHAAKHAFGLYLLTAVGYGTLYGILGLLPIFTVWIWLGWAIVLGGAETAYVVQHRARLAASERRRRGAPFIEPGWAALELVLHAGGVLRAGGRPASGEELELALGLPGYLWKSLVGALLDRNILVRAGTGYTPGRPLEKLLVEDVLTAIEDAVIARPDENWHERAKLQGLFDSLTRARRRELGGLTVAELLDRS